MSAILWNASDRVKRKNMQLYVNKSVFLAEIDNLRLAHVTAERKLIAESERMRVSAKLQEIMHFINPDS